MNLKSIILILCLLIQQDLFAQQEAISFRFRGCKIQGDTLSALDPKSFNFGFDARLAVNDTLKVIVIHHRDSVPQTRLTFSLLKEKRDSINIVMDKLKEGDGLYLIFLLRGVEVLRKNFYVASTIYSLQTPYYYDVYFIYNEDTVAADRYILGTRMKLERHGNFKRIFFNKPNEITRNFEVITKTAYTQFSISHYSVYHGKVTVQFFDKEPLIEKHGFEQSVEVSDMDGDSPSNLGEYRSGVRRAKD